MAHYIAGNFEEVKEEIYQFYMDSYVEPIRTRGHPFTTAVQPALLSCAINCGVVTAVELYVQAGGNDRKFLSIWHQHYIN
jgi:hypothetical protein